MKELIVNIYHEAEHTPYAIRTSSGVLLAGLRTIEQVADWLKNHGGGFTPDTGPKETEAGWTREASIPMWEYQKLAPRQLEKAA